MKHRYKIALNTLTDVTNFVNLASQSTVKILLTNRDGNFTVSAKSLLGVLYSMEWDNVYCVSDDEIFSIVKNYLVEEN